MHSKTAIFGEKFSFNSANIKAQINTQLVKEYFKKFSRRGSLKNCPLTSSNTSKQNLHRILTSVRRYTAALPTQILVTVSQYLLLAQLNHGLY